MCDGSKFVTQEKLDTVLFNEFKISIMRGCYNFFPFIYFVSLCYKNINGTSNIISYGSTDYNILVIINNIFCLAVN